MKNKPRLSHAEEYLYKLSTKTKFGEFLAGVREKMGVPADGIGETITWRKDFEKLMDDPKKSLDLLVFTELAQFKYRIPLAYSPYISFYLCLGYIPRELEESFGVRILAPTRMTNPNDPYGEKEIGKYFPHEPYARLIVFATNTKSEVIKFIEENWHEVEKVFKEQGWSRPKKIRQTVHKKRNRLIHELWHKPTNELQEIAGLKSGYKEKLIRKILSDQGTPISEGYIRKLRYPK
jgi:hypothetical protein